MDHLKNSKKRRSSNERRKFSYTAYVPERRLGKDRRAVNAIKIRVKVA